MTGKWRPPSSTFALFGLFGVGNYGNEGSLEAAIHSIQRKLPNSCIVCICEDPKAVTERYAIPCESFRPPSYIVEPWRWLPRPARRLIRKLREIVWLWRRLNNIDAVIIPGTGILDDFGERPFDMPLRLFLLALFSRLRRVPLAYFAVGAGPIENPLNRLFMKFSAHMASYRSFRDKQSKHYMQSIGLDCATDAVVPDIAFLLPRPNDRASHRPFSIALGVMAYRGWTNTNSDTYNNYIASLTEIALHYLREGAHIHLIRGEQGDDDAIQRLVTSIHSSHPQFAERLIEEAASDLSSIMKTFADVDVAIVTRFHNLVCALQMHCPVYAFDYGGKNASLLARCGLGDFCQPADEIDVSECIRQLSHLVDQREEYESLIANAVLGFSRDVENELDTLLAVLSERICFG